MLDELRALSRHFIKLKFSPFRRYLIEKKEFTHRLTIVIGQRGVGKTTTLIQFLLDQVNGDRHSDQILYIQADHFQIGNLSLYEIAESFSSYGGKWLAIDEIHKCPNWSQELKSIYDTFPNLSVLASGSSALEIHRGSHDLTRRAICYTMQGMSFREFIELNYQIQLPTLLLNDICREHERIADEILEKVGAILPVFEKYLKIGYYPYYYELNSESLYKITLEQNLHTTIESDLVAIYPHLTGSSINKIKQLLIYIANAVPFTPNWSKIQQVVDIGDVRTLKTYFSHLVDARLIRTLRGATSKFKQLESLEKVFLNNTNQLYAIAPTPNKGTLRETFFLSQLSESHEIRIPQNGDFLVDGQFCFEVGGRKKSFDQIKGKKNSYLSCDEMERGVGNKIPLWLFGFLY